MRHIASNRARNAVRKRFGFAALLALVAAPAHASFLSGETLDTAADVLAWIVLFLAPIIGIAVFLLIHILPEKIAEKRNHPQLGAIKTLCILSLFFGGMLWPIAWLWAYTKPVLHKMAYGTDVHEGEKELPPAEDEARVVGAKLQRVNLDERDRHSAEA